MSINSTTNRQKQTHKASRTSRGCLHIIGSGSALPTKDHFPTSQMLEMREKQYMIDCGEGAQIRIRQMNLKTNRMGHVFITHLHGDHCFGLIGMITTFGMLNRTADLHIHAHPDLERILTPLLNYFCRDIPFKVYFNPVDSTLHTLVHEDRSTEVYSIPLKHRVPSCGFLFQEKTGPRHIKRDMIDFYNVPMSRIGGIKLGEDFITPEGETVPNHVFTTPPTPPIRYAYCSDTAYNESIVPIISEVDLLYHEATFAEDQLARAQQTMHSTARQAAEIARLANVKKLVLGHFSARYTNKNILLNEAKTVFENTILAEDMMTIGL